jgi:hypothetical protein
VHVRRDLDEISNYVLKEVREGVPWNATVVERGHELPELTFAVIEYVLVAELGGVQVSMEPGYHRSVLQRCKTIE